MQTNSSLDAKQPQRRLILIVESDPKLSGKYARRLGGTLGEEFDVRVVSKIAEARVIFVAEIERVHLVAIGKVPCLEQREVQYQCRDFINTLQLTDDPPVIFADLKNGGGSPDGLIPSILSHVRPAIKRHGKESILV